MKIITNHQPRHTLYWHELSTKEQEEFDYLDTDEKRNDTTFFRYKKNIYDLSDFMRTDAGFFKPWDGYRSDSFYSGIVVKYVKPDYEQVIVGLYLA